MLALQMIGTVAIEKAQRNTHNAPYSASMAQLELMMTDALQH